MSGGGENAHHASDNTNDSTLTRAVITFVATLSVVYLVMNMLSDHILLYTVASYMLIDGFVRYGWRQSMRDLMQCSLNANGGGDNGDVVSAILSSYVGTSVMTASNQLTYVMDKMAPGGSTTMDGQQDATPTTPASIKCVVMIGNQVAKVVQVLHQALSSKPQTSNVVNDKVDRNYSGNHTNHNDRDEFVARKSSSKRRTRSDATAHSSSKRGSRSDQ